MPFQSARRWPVPAVRHALCFSLCRDCFTAHRYISDGAVYINGDAMCLAARQRVYWRYGLFLQRLYACPCTTAHVLRTSPRAQSVITYLHMVFIFAVFIFILRHDQKCGPK